MSETELVSEETSPASPGRALAAARAELNLSIADVSQQIKFGVKQIAAIEADDYAKLPGMTFVRGMIRSYAKLVQLDPQPLLAGLGGREIPAAVTVGLGTSAQEPFLEGGKKSNRIYGVLSIVALAAVAVVAYEWHAGPPSTGEVVRIAPRVAKTEPVQALPSPVSVTEQPRAPDAQPMQQGSQVAEPASATSRKVGELKRIELEFDQISWVEIKQSNGKVLLSRLNPAGSKQQIEGLPPFEVVIGNAAHVRMAYNDALVDLRPYASVDVARLTLE